MPKFRKKPVVVEAVQWNGSNFDEVMAFMGNSGRAIKQYLGGGRLVIEALGGEQIAEKGDFIIKGIKGELYRSNPDRFGQTYEPVDDEGEPPWPLLRLKPCEGSAVAASGCDYWVDVRRIVALCSFFGGKHQETNITLDSGAQFTVAAEERPRIEAALCKLFFRNWEEVN